ncbi:MAG: hypothetical protein ACTS9Y_00600 [Methylophilus sp.]|uniref:hypothetical protein n=1 Tax=Methylophilus sp. TaxID=29541 RepID=UPI003FA013A4
MIKFSVTRLAGHPWDGSNRPNFDLMEVSATTRLELDSFIDLAGKKFWAVWIAGILADAEPPNAYAGVLYKPSGVMEAWIDNLKQPHPGGQPDLIPSP